MELLFVGGLHKMCMFHEPAGFRPNIFYTFSRGHSKFTVLYLLGKDCQGLKKMHLFEPPAHREQEPWVKL